MANAPPSLHRNKEPSNLLLFILFLLFILLIYAILKGDGHSADDASYSAQSVQTSRETAQADPYITKSGQLKPRVRPDPVENDLIDIMDPGSYSMMDVPPNVDVHFDQGIDAIVAFRIGPPGESRWRMQRIKDPTVVNSGKATHMIYWAFPSMSKRDIDARMAAALQYLAAAGVLY